MRGYRKFFLLLVLLASALPAFNQANAASIRELLGLENDTGQTADSVKADAGTQKTAAKSDQDWGKQNEGKKKLSLSYGEIQRILANVNLNERKALLNDPDKFKQFVQQEANNLSVLSAARANKVDQDDNTKFLMKLSAENVVREIYLNKLIAAKIPADFPTDQQVRQYFDKNKDQFFIGKRVHVWQIFLRFDPKMSKDQVASVRDRMNKIRQDIVDKKIDFADAAFKYSEHGPSKTTGGYMGLIKVADLKPELSKVLLNLPEGKLSEPIQSDTGIHILKRGTIIPRQDVTFEEVKAQIHNLLVKQAKTQLRQAIYNQAEKTYPVDLQDKNIENWRQRLMK